MLRHLRQIRPRLQRSYNNIGSTVAPDATRVKELQRYGRNLEVQALVVDAQIFRRKGGAPLQASALAFDSSRKVAGGQQVASKEMLTKAVREELRARSSSLTAFVSISLLATCWPPATFRELSKASALACSGAPPFLRKIWASTTRAWTSRLRP